MPHFTSSDGLAIAYHLWGDERGQVPVVLHHGFGVSAAINWELPGIVAALVTAGHRVIGIDARGHGQSDKPHDSAFYGEAAMARDLGELITHLALPKVHLVGYSMGSVVSVIAAAGDSRIVRLAIGGVGSGIVEMGGVDTRAVTGQAIAAALLADDPASVTGSAKPFRDLADMTGADRHALAAHAMVVHAAPIALERIAAPTLVIAGDADPLAQHPQILVDALPDARLAMVPGDHRDAVMAPALTAALLGFLDPS